MGFFASVNGIVTPAAEAKVSVLDNGFTFGDSVYETLRTYRGRPFHLERHLTRLRASASRLGIAIPQGDEVFAQRLDEILARAHNDESYIRMIVSRGEGDVSYRFDRVQGPTVILLVKPYEPFPTSHYAQGVPVILSSVRRNHPSALDPAIKTCNLLNNILAMQEAQAKGALEPILLNAAGELAEGAGSNFFVVRGGHALTPPLGAGILAGVTRAALLEIGPSIGVPTREQALLPGDLFAADEAFLTSTLKEVMPICSVDGRSIAKGAPGPVTLRLLQAFREYAPRHCA
jgi:branched-chain amino acid aminotransferase